MQFSANKRVLAIGEAMVELAPVGDGLFKRGFAGDTFNTAWHMVQILGQGASVGYVTKVGQDAVSDAFCAELEADGLDTTGIARDPDRTMGLYLIELDGAERSFQYWRAQSAARMLAEDVDTLTRQITDAGLVHLSGITVAILSADARKKLLAALKAARAKGALVSFDPNVRPKLWGSLDEVRATLPGFISEADIALPSFDDETLCWGDATPADTLARYEGLGVSEVVVKNGESDVHVLSAKKRLTFDTGAVATVKDTSGAGDAFNAGYLAGRLKGLSVDASVRKGQALAGDVIGHFGARLPKEATKAYAYDAN